MPGDARKSICSILVLTMLTILVTDDGRAQEGSHGHCMGACTCGAAIKEAGQWQHGLHHQGKMPSFVPPSPNCCVLHSVSALASLESAARCTFSADTQRHLGS
jgi:hypothetical protein